MKSVERYREAKEYDVATRFFDELLGAAGLGRKQLFVVPGNHDVDRKKSVGCMDASTPRAWAPAYI